MNNQPLIFERIIRGDLRPWLDKNKQDEKFETRIGNLEIIAPHFQPLYEIDFYRWFNCKTKYYHKLIVNGANNYCNRIIELVNTEENIRVKKYSLGRRFRKIKALLRESANLINDNYYELQYIDTSKSDFDNGRDHKEDTYVIQFLKTALLKVYLEIQEVFKTFIPEEDYMKIEDLYLQVLCDPIPEETFLKRIKIEEYVDYEVKTYERNPAHARPTSFKFDRLATNPGVLIDLMDALKFLLLIDKTSSIYDFKKVFSGKEIGNPIRWTGNDSEYYWFIYLIYTKYKFVEDLRQQQWKVAVQSFVRADWTHFEGSKLRKLKKPQYTGMEIEKAVKLLK